MKRIKELLLLALSRALRLLGLHPTIARVASGWQYTAEERKGRRLGRRKENAFQVLTYHRVNDEDDPYFKGTPTGVLARQVEYLKCYYSVIDLHQALSGEPLPDRAICLTFDDGYLDNYTHAFPILRAARIPATIFLATGFIGTDRKIWHDEVFHAFRTTSKSLLQWRGMPFDGASLRSFDNRRLIMERFLDFVRTLSPGQRDSTITALQERLNVISLTGQEERLMLNWDEVREMSRDGITFGAHTVNHNLLSTVTGDELYDEVEGSRRALENNLGESPKLFAYPNGRLQDFGAESVNVLRKVGFKAAVTATFGINTSASDRFRLARMSVAGNHADLFGTRLAWYRFTNATF